MERACGEQAFVGTKSADVARQGRLLRRSNVSERDILRPNDAQTSCVVTRHSPRESLSLLSPFAPCHRQLIIGRKQQKRKIPRTILAPQVGPYPASKTYLAVIQPSASLRASGGDA
jgi:hypothetical protein